MLVDNLTVRVITGVSKDISMVQLQNLISSDDDRLESVKNGLKAQMSGEFLRSITQNTEKMLTTFEQEFEKQWEEMCDRHVKRVSRGMYEYLAKSAEQQTSVPSESVQSSRPSDDGVEIPNGSSGSE